MKLNEGEAKEMGKENNVAEKESGKEGEKDKKDETHTPAKKATTNGTVSNSAANAALDSGGDVTMGTPTPKGKGKVGNEGGMISPESLEAT